jgi:hypothetical protein
VTDPKEVHVIAGKVLELLSTIDTSSEVLCAALKVAHTAVDEARSAQMNVEAKEAILKNLRGRF